MIDISEAPGPLNGDRWDVHADALAMCRAAVEERDLDLAAIVRCSSDLPALARELAYVAVVMSEHLLINVGVAKPGAATRYLIMQQQNAHNEHRAEATTDD